jgi:hypothetical protein
MDEWKMVQSRLGSTYTGSGNQEPLIPIALVNAIVRPLETIHVTRDLVLRR